MPAPKGITWNIERHTQAKHVILRKYLEAWFPIMTRYNQRVIIIDGFAGPGEYSQGELGSPLITLDVIRNHRPEVQSREIELYFIEAEPPRCLHLEELLEKVELPPNTWYTIYPGKFDATIPIVLDRLGEPERVGAPLFAFLDPFGFSHTPMQLVATLMARAKSEVLITFMYEEINRFYEHPSSFIHTDFDELFGCSDWRQIGRLRDSKARLRQTHDLYLHQLQTSGCAQYARSFKMKNRSNSTDYFLFFGTNSIDGMAKMKDAMWVADPTGTYEFSDFTDPNQMLLFEAHPNFEALGRQLVEQFAGHIVTVGQVEEFVILRTAFKSTHYKGVLKKLEEEQQLQAIGRIGRRGTFADPSMQLRFSAHTRPTLF